MGYFAAIYEGDLEYLILSIGGIANGLLFRIYEKIRK